MDIDIFRERSNLALQRRQLWESMWEDCINYCMPGRQSFFNTRKGQEKTELVFDETPIAATAEFASRMQSAILPPGRKWFNLVLSEAVQGPERDRLVAGLDDISEYLWKQILRSNFDAEVPEAFMDIAIGTCAIHCDLDPLNRLVFKTAPLPTIAIDEGPDGRVGGVFRKRSNLSADKLRALYPEADIPPNSKDSFDLVEGSIRNYDAMDAEEYHYRVWIEQTLQVLRSSVSKGWGSSPWICARWAETAEEWYGRGPLINLLPAIRSVNLIREMIFENAELAIGGVWQYPNDGTINPNQIEIAPNTFIPKAPGSTGLEPLQSPARFDIAEANLQDLRSTIKRGLFSEEYTPRGRTPLSAQEIAAMQTDMANRIGAPFSRLVVELVQPTIIRAARLYSDAGLIEIPKIDGEMISVVPASPLVQAQNAETITRMTSFVSTVVNIMGPEMAGTFLDPEGTIKMLAELYQYPGRLLMNNQDRVKKAKEGQEMQKQLQDALRTLPNQEIQQRVEKGPLQPVL